MFLEYQQAWGHGHFPEDLVLVLDYPLNNNVNTVNSSKWLADCMCPENIHRHLYSDCVSTKKYHIRLFPCISDLIKVSPQ